MLKVSYCRGNVTRANHELTADLDRVQIHFRRLPALPQMICTPSKRLQAATDIVSPPQSACSPVTGMQQQIVTTQTAALCRGSCVHAAPGLPLVRL